MFNLIRIPSILAFFVTGIVIGPHGLGLIGSVSQVEIIAEFGIIFLLFTIGMDFSLDKFSQIKRYAVLGGSLQVGLTVLAVFLVSMALGLPFTESIFIGLLVCFSSTAIDNYLTPIAVARKEETIRELDDNFQLMPDDVLIYTKKDDGI